MFPLYKRFRFLKIISSSFKFMSLAEIQSYTIEIIIISFLQNIILFLSRQILTLSVPLVYTSIEFDEII